jgi:ABC-type Fe3+ transport system permease subunit
MFCNGCGSELQAGYNVCPKCGKVIGDPVSAITRSRLQNHLSILGTFWIIVGVLFLIPSLGLFFASGAAHFVIHDNVFARTLGPALFTLLGGTFLVLAIGGILVGLGLRDRKPWARTIAIVLGVLSLFHPPVGTALGIYTLWVLMSDDGGVEYRRLSTSA